MKQDDSNIIELISKVNIHNPKITNFRYFSYNFTLPGEDGIHNEFQVSKFMGMFYFRPDFETKLLYKPVGMKKPTKIIFKASRKLKKQLYDTVDSLFIRQENTIKRNVIRNLK